MINLPIDVGAQLDQERASRMADRRREIFESVALALLSNYPGISDSDELLRRTGDITTAILKAADEFAKEEPKP